MTYDITAHHSRGRSAVESEPWNALFGADGSAAGIPLGTARWLPPETASEKFAYEGSLLADRIWMGEAFDWYGTPLGYADDRHVCLVSGSRGGKGVGVIVPNLCFWPGSAIVVASKGSFAVPRNLKQRCKALWPEFTRLNLRWFEVAEPWQFCTIHSEQGLACTKIVPPTGEWEALQAAAAARDTPKVPELLRADPVLLLLFVIMVPQRATPDVIRFLGREFSDIWFLP